MPLTDIYVTVSLVKPTAIPVFGKPLILTTASVEADAKDYASLDAVAVDYAVDTPAYAMARAIYKQNPTSAPIITIAAAATAAALPTALDSVYDRDWYFLLTTSSAIADIKALADVVEEKGRKLFSARVSLAADYTTLKAEEYDRTFVQFTNTPAEYPDAAWVGYTGAKDVGRVTWKNQQVQGLTPLDLTELELLAIHNGGANTFVTKSGDKVTSEGRVVSGEFIDVMTAKDWVESTIQRRTQQVLTRTDKVPYSAAGVAQLEASVVTTLKEAFLQGMISETDGTPDYSTNFRSIANQTAADRATRTYRGGTFRFRLEGAIHTAYIDGEIIL